MNLKEEIIKATTNQKDDELPLLEDLFDFCQSFLMFTTTKI